MIKIGVISDSHHRSDVAKSAIRYLKEKSVDLIVHAGDIVETITLKDLQNSNIPYYAILGNNDKHLKHLIDNHNLFEEPKLIDFKGIKIRVMHHPFYIKSDSDIIIYGHTHNFVATTNDNKLYLNPGEICARKKKLHEFTYVTCEKNPSSERLEFKVYKVESEISKINWSEKEINI